jgi:hypothetical protein
MTNEEKLNNTLHDVFPHTIFIRRMDVEHGICEIHMSKEWLNAPYEENEEECTDN